LLLPGLPLFFLTRKFAAGSDLSLGSAGVWLSSGSMPHSPLRLTCVILLLPSRRFATGARFSRRPPARPCAVLDYQFLLATDVGLGPCRTVSCDNLVGLRGDPRHALSSRKARADLPASPDHGALRIRIIICTTSGFTRSGNRHAKVSLGLCEVDPAQNAKLLRVFSRSPDRLVEPDNDNTELLPYAVAACSARTKLPATSSFSARDTKCNPRPARKRLTGVRVLAALGWSVRLP